MCWSNKWLTPYACAHIHSLQTNRFWTCHSSKPGVCIIIQQRQASEIWFATKNFVNREKADNSYGANCNNSRMAGFFQVPINFCHNWQLCHENVLILWGQRHEVSSVNVCTHMNLWRINSLHSITRDSHRTNNFPFSFLFCHQYGCGKPTTSTARSFTTWS